MIRIYHVSDLHVGKFMAAPKVNSTGASDGVSHRAHVKSLLDFVVKDAGNSAGAKCLLVITGDITDSGSEHQYEEAQKLLAEVKKVLDVRIVPGNHDMGGGLGTKVEVASFERFDDLATSLGMKAEFRYRLSSSYQGYMPATELIESGGEHVLLVYLNSCSPLGLKDFARGSFGEAQKINLVMTLATIDPSISVVLCLHHKPLKKANKFTGTVMNLEEQDREFLENIAGRFNVKAILFGHQDDKELSNNTYQSIGSNEKCYIVDANDSVKFGPLVLEFDQGGLTVTRHQISLIL